MSKHSDSKPNGGAFSQSTMVHWKELYRTLAISLCRPWSHPPFTFYFILGVLLLGASGFWFLLIQQLTITGLCLPDLLTALATFIPAVSLASTWEIVFPDRYGRSIRSLAMLVATLCVLCAVLTLLSASLRLNWGIVPLVPGLLLSLCSWIIANGENPNLLTSTDPSDSVGGDIDRPLPGSLEGFRNE